MPVGGGSTGGASAGSVRAGRAFVEFFGDDTRLARTLSSIKSRVQSVGSFIGKTGLGLAGLGAGLLAPLAPLLESVTAGGKLANAAEAFGLTADEASRLFGIMRASGSELKDALEGLVTFNQRVAEGLEGTGEEARKLFEGLGRGPETFAGNSAQKFYQLIDALRGVADPAKRVQLLLKAVGEDTGKNLIPLLSMTDQQIQRLGDSFAMTAEDLQAQRQASMAYQLAVAGIGRVWQQVVIGAAPMIQEFAAIVTANVKPLAEWVSRNKELVVTVLAVGAGLLVAGTALGVFGFALSGIATVAGAVVAALAFLGPEGLLVLGIAAAAVALIDFGDTFKLVGEVASETWGGIVAAVQKGDLELAFKIVGAGVKVIWRELLLSLAKAWNEFVTSILGFVIRNPWILGPAKNLLGFVPFDNLNADVGPAEAAVAAARAELAALGRQARAPAPDGAAADAKRFQEEMAKRLQPADRVKGSFATPFAERQFGFGDSVQKKQLDAQKDIVKNTAQILGEMNVLALAMRLR